jgi:hypothetical protein
VRQEGDGSQAIPDRFGDLEVDAYCRIITSIKAQIIAPATFF